MSTYMYQLWSKKKGHTTIPIHQGLPKGFEGTPDDPVYGYSPRSGLAEMLVHGRCDRAMHYSALPAEFKTILLIEGAV